MTFTADCGVASDFHGGLANSIDRVTRNLHHIMIPFRDTSV
jgi:hypothetical protein